MLVRVPGNLYKKKLRIISYSFLFESASHLLLAFQHNFDPPQKNASLNDEPFLSCCIIPLIQLLFISLSLLRMSFLFGSDVTTFRLYTRKKQRTKDKRTAHISISLYTCTQSKTLKIYGNTKEIGRGEKNFFFRVCVCGATSTMLVFPL